MPLRTLNYHVPFYYKNAHIQTIYPSLYRKVEPLKAQSIRLTTYDDDFIDLDQYKNNSKKCVIISHGLEGNSQRHYVQGMSKAMIESGFDTICWNYRSCSGELNKKPFFYHSAFTPDLETVIQYAEKHYTELYLLGFSMGGNLSLYYAANTFNPKIRKICAISVPMDLKGSSYKLAQWQNKVYMKRFIDLLGLKIKAKEALNPGTFDLKGYHLIKSFHEFDNAFTAPMFGFKNALDYWHQASSLHVLEKIQTETLILQAKNDPFLSESCLPMEICKNSSNITLALTKNGGHVGFKNFDSSPYYFDEQIAIEFFLK